MRFRTATLALAVLLAGACGAAESQFRADANLVLINATVLDRHDRPVRGLTRDRFRLYEDKAEQNIIYFSEEDVPLSLAVIFDVSGSMDGKMPGMRAALNAVLDGANTQDEFSLVTFADQPTIAAGWNPNPDEILNHLLLHPAHGQTALLDALETGLASLKIARNPRKAMLIFSDGGDNHSRASERHLLRSLEESGVQIYAVDTADPLLSRALSPEEARRTGFAGSDLRSRRRPLFPCGRQTRAGFRRAADSARAAFAIFDWLYAGQPRSGRPLPPRSSAGDASGRNATDLGFLAAGLSRTRRLNRA